MFLIIPDLGIVKNKLIVRILSLCDLWEKKRKTQCRELNLLFLLQAG